MTKTSRRGFLAALGGALAALVAKSLPSGKSNTYGDYTFEPIGSGQVWVHRSYSLGFTVPPEQEEWLRRHDKWLRGSWRGHFR
jgi:hypothetical protein